MERAFLMYGDKAYARDWCRRANLTNALPILRSQFDVQFVAYLEPVVPRTGRAAP
jgi:hypothetical protein